MANFPHLKFIHTSDLRLGAVPHGLDAVSPQLRERLLEASWNAARNVFDAAVQHQVDFVLLSGTTAEPWAADVQAPMFLMEQFQKLHRQGIAVFRLCNSKASGGNWPAWIPVTPNVHVLRSHNGDDTHFEKDGRRSVAITAVVGNHLREAGVVSKDCDGIVTAAGYAGRESELASRFGSVRYFALRGHKSATFSPRESGLAHAPGSPQGFGPDEVGPMSCSLVETEPSGRIHVSRCETDVCRWLTETVQVDAAHDVQALVQRIQSRAAELRRQQTNRELLVTWLLTGNVAGLVRRIGATGFDRALQALRTATGVAPSSVWSVSIDLDPSFGVLPEWNEHDTCLGDFLQIAAQIDRRKNGAIGDESELGHSRLPIAAPSTQTDADHRRTVLRQSVQLGVDLLG